MPVTNKNLGVIVRTMAQANADALRAGAQVYRNAMQESLQGGYTSGHYYSGMQGVAGSVNVSEPQRDELGGYIVVGTNVEYAKYWEMGHHNLFMWDGRGSGPPFVRVEKWRPTMVEKAPAIVAKYAAKYAEIMERAGLDPALGQRRSPTP